MITQEQLKGATVKQLQSAQRMLSNSVDAMDCFSAGDILMLIEVEAELEKRQNKGE